MTNTGTPQGTVLPPFLFSLVTADCRSFHDDYIITKYTDCTVLTGQITDNNDTHFRQEIDSFVQWCDLNYVEFNVCKKMEMLIGFRTNITVHDVVVIKGVEIGRVATYK